MSIAMEELVRKLLLSSVVAFFAKGSLFQVAIGSLISNCALLLHIYYRPYRKSIFNQYAGTALFVIWLTHLAAGILQARPDSESYALAVLLVLCNVAVALGPAMVAVLFAIQLIPESVLRKLGLEKSVDSMSFTEITSTKEVISIEMQSTSSPDQLEPNEDNPPAIEPEVQDQTNNDEYKVEEVESHPKLSADEDQINDDYKVVEVESITMPASDEDQTNDYDYTVVEVDANPKSCADESQSNDEYKVVEVESITMPSSDESQPNDDCEVIEVEPNTMPVSDEKKTEFGEVEMTSCDSPQCYISQI
eukprot:TRINITY_DN3801_c0_g1_i10.p2 TRINITY_DN3801_c0_g1~~TRINITY_DN3801_c0_g1_i10.p2  ORF type:complete len:306 (+),score=55.40 TRINITY_DN3801_c0_g1_i10:1615-2532(+)